MKLYCMRHCDALAVEVDPERHLSDQGNSDAHKIADHLQSQATHIPHVIHSGVTRAKETALILSTACGAEKVEEAPLLLGENAALDAVVSVATHAAEDTLLVGHMPFMSHLVAELLMEQNNSAHLITFPPGTVVCLKRLSPEQWMIDWILKPENLGLC